MSETRGAKRKAASIAESRIAVARAYALLTVGEESELTLDELCENLQPDESEKVLQVVMSLACKDLAYLVDGLAPSQVHSNVAPIGRAPRDRTATRDEDPSVQALAPDAFDELVVDAIKTLSGTQDVKNGALLDHLRCSRGKLRLSLERLKKAGTVRQTGERNGATYEVA